MGNTYQVVIVGGGPVGVALAVNLGLRGISCALVERRLLPQRIPKGQNLLQRSVEHFWTWGLADELRAARVMPKEFPMNGIIAYGSLSTDWWYAPPLRELLNQYYFLENERLPQYRMEEVLRRKMATLPNVDARFGWVAETVEQDADGVYVSIAEENGPGREILRGDYSVGCDGSHSRVRDQIGIARGGEDFDQLMVLAVFRSRALSEVIKSRFPERSTFRVMRRELDGYWEFFGRVDTDEGWFFHAPVPADTTRDNYDFHGLLQRVAGFEFDCEFDYVGFWDLRIAVADRYRVGRVFIAGDAAHSHPPYGGYGLNNGLEDIVNLGWKLEAVLKGWGGEALLDTYGEERQPVFVETGRDFIAGRIETDRAFFEKYNPDNDLAAFERAWKDEHAGAAAPRVLTYEPNYEGSSVVAGPPGAVCSAHGRHSFEARPGHHLPSRTLSDGRNVFEALGRGFTLIALDAPDGAAEKFEDAAATLDIPFDLVIDSYADGREEFGARLILVRPDQYVVWCGDTPPTNAEYLLHKCTASS